MLAREAGGCLYAGIIRIELLSFSIKKFGYKTLKLKLSLSVFFSYVYSDSQLSRRLHKFVTKLCETLRFPQRLSAFKLFVMNL
jgi:hypothetical protein